MFELLMFNNNDDEMIHGIYCGLSSKCLCILTQLVLITALRYNRYTYSHFSDEDTGTQRV